MWLVWIGLALVAMKAAEVGPVAAWSWWAVLAPLAGALVWFEALERVFGRDRRKLAHDDVQQRQRERAREAFERVNGRRRR